MNKLIIIGISIIVLIIAVLLGSLVDTCPTIDGWAVTVPYCEHMGYTMIIDSENKPICVFDDFTICSIYDFYYGECGQDKVKELRKRTLCEDVYLQFEECEEGLVPSERKYLLEQEHCREMNWWEKWQKH